MEVMRSWLFKGLILLSFTAFSQDLRDVKVIEEVDIIPDNTYDEMADRIACMESEVPLHFNERVMAFV